MRAWAKGLGFRGLGASNSRFKIQGLINASPAVLAPVQPRPPFRTDRDRGGTGGEGGGGGGGGMGGGGGGGGSGFRQDF